MIDVHSHIIFDVDDGPRDLEESLRMLSEAEKVGITTIIATPHLKGSFSVIKKVDENFEMLQQKSKDFGILLKKGYEVLINTYITDEMYKEGTINLGSTPYVLVEFPVDSISPYGREAIYRMQINKLTPVIAHPERSKALRKDPLLLDELIDCGCRLQVDASSVLGVFGLRAKRMAKRLLKQGTVHYMSSDAHCPEDYSDLYRLAYNKVLKWVGREYTESLYSTNAEEILQKEEKIEIDI